MPPLCQKDAHSESGGRRGIRTPMGLRPAASKADLYTSSSIRPSHVRTRLAQACENCAIPVSHFSAFSSKRLLSTKDKPWGLRLGRGGARFGIVNCADSPIECPRFAEQAASESPTVHRAMAGGRRRASFETPCRGLDPTTQTLRNQSSRLEPRRPRVSEPRAALSDFPRVPAAPASANFAQRQRVADAPRAFESLHSEPRGTTPPCRGAHSHRTIDAGLVDVTRPWAQACSLRPARQPERSPLREIVAQGAFRRAL